MDRTKPKFRRKLTQISYDGVHWVDEQCDTEEILDGSEVIADLNEKIQQAGTITAYAVTNSMSTSYVCDVLKGRRDLSPKILDSLGLQKEVRYKRWR
jgi:hypothetical protein